ncbi:MAG: NAD(P)H-hydrate dehydratase [Planctomycetia bacterium]
MPVPAPTTPDLPRLSPRARDTSKRDYGRVIVIGGAAGMAGAPALTGMAALRGGAGLVDVIVPQSVAPITASFDPCLMVTGLPCDEEGRFSEAATPRMLQRLEAATAVAVGPGIGRSGAVTAIVRGLWRDLPQPAVFDADALWALAQLDGADLSSHAGVRILTPHAGEMLRLVHDDPASPRSHDRDFLEVKAAEMASAIDAVVVLKGPATLVVDRRRRARNETGNPGMATGGTGDVLTGLIAALLAQGLGPFEAARLGAWIHGRAGDIAAADRGEISMTARDLLECLPAAFRAAVD